MDVDIVTSVRIFTYTVQFDCEEQDERTVAHDGIIINMITFNTVTQ